MADDGRMCLSNKAAQRELRGIALARKAWLFAGSDRGGERAALMLMLIHTAKLNDVDPKPGSPTCWPADLPLIDPAPDGLSPRRCHLSSERLARRSLVRAHADAVSGFGFGPIGLSTGRCHLRRLARERVGPTASIRYAHTNLRPF